MRIPTVMDTETHLIEPGLLAPRLVCASWKDPTRPAEVLEREAAIKQARAILTDKNRIFVGANVAFDLGVLCAADPWLLPIVFEALEDGRVSDTHIRQALIDIHDGVLGLDRTKPKDGWPGYANLNGRISVEYLARLYLGLDLSAEKNDPNSPRLRYAEVDGLPLSEWPEEFVAYSKGDADHELAIWLAQEGKPNLHDEPAQVRAAFCLHLMSIWGFRTDPGAVAAFEAKVTETHEAMQAKFQAAGIFRVGGTKKATKLVKNTKALAALVDKAYLGAAPKTEKGAIKLDRDTLRESGDDLLAEFADAGENEKLYTTYLGILKQGTSKPINPGYNALVASGRTSSYSPNVQNLPRKGGVREAVVPRAGNAFVFCDYSTLELRTLAQACLNLVGQSEMAEALRRKEDLHTRIGAAIANTSYSELAARIQAGDKEAEDFRQMAKAVNFGLPGGLGAEKLVAYARLSYKAQFCVLSKRADVCGTNMGLTRQGKPICLVCLDVARELKSLWLRTWPEMQDYFRYVTKMTDGYDGGSLEQIGSRRIRGACGFTDGCNTFFQGLAADGMKRAMWLVTKECYVDRKSPLFGARPWGMIHDELILECPVNRVDAVARRLADRMIVGMSEYVPDVPVEVSFAASSRWWKGAKPVFRDGVLVLWEPPAKKAA